MAIGIANPQVLINNVNIRIVPNSLTYDGGEGEANVRAASAGGNSIESVHTSNAETKTSMVKFDVYLTPDVDTLISEWKVNLGLNSISLAEKTGNGTSFTRSFDRMSLTNRVERNASADGVVSLEFSGDPMSRQ